MFRDLTLGQYYPVDSLIHRLDARTKLLMTLIHIIALFTARDFLAYALAAAVLVIWVALSKVPVGYMLRGLKPILFLLFISVFFNIFWTKGEILFALGPIAVTREGLLQAARMALRLILLIFGTSLLTYTTSPTQLTAGLEQGLHFLNYIRIPVHEIAMMMTIALRFLPILTEETNKIIMAQKARGADFETGNMIRRAKVMVPILVPLFVSAFRRANDLAMAMEARCYHGGEGRTRMKPLKFGKADYIAIILFAVYLAAMIVL
ncbi:MAG: energy-coupling factor transporter transmembrane protein EcfT [Lachnospiraceae bacterium]|nr:energy-coupling factor transporter transmembrane protein EcfT [Lachnospiraceae bacterium]